MNELQDEIERLRAAIRKHMNMPGDDRCYQDDHELYSVLPEGDTRPEKDIAVTLPNCERYIRCRQEGIRYISPNEVITNLEARIDELESSLNWYKTELERVKAL